MSTQRFAFWNLAIFSGVGGGKRSGVNLVAFPKFPLIFIFPYKKAFCGLSLPVQIPSKSSSNIVKVASALSDLVASTLPFPFLRSIVHVFTTSPPFTFKISKLNTD